VSLERGPLSLVNTIEELLGGKSSGSGIEIREYGRRDPLRRSLVTLYPQKVALTSPRSGCRSVGIVRSRTYLFYLCRRPRFILADGRGRGRYYRTLEINEVIGLYLKFGSDCLQDKRTMFTRCANVACFGPNHWGGWSRSLWDLSPLLVIKQEYLRKSCPGPISLNGVFSSYLELRTMDTVQKPIVIEVSSF
jgi:hypothetical protein